MHTIRAAHEQDAKSIALLLCELGYSEVDESKVMRTFAEVLASKFMGIRVAVFAGEVVGFVSYSWKPQLRLCGLSMELDELVVTAKVRGEGIGQMLLHEVIEVARFQGVHRLILSTNRKRESYARKFYEKNGFVEKDSAWLCLDLKR
jgi:PhnO protein